MVNGIVFNNITYMKSLVEESKEFLNVKVIRHQKKSLIYKMFLN